MLLHKFNWHKFTAMSNSYFLIKPLFIWNANFKFLFTLRKLNWHKFTSMSNSNFLFKRIFVWNSSKELWFWASLSIFNRHKFSTFVNSNSFSDGFTITITISKLLLTVFNWMKRSRWGVSNSDGFSNWFFSKSFSKWFSLFLKLRN